MMTMEQELKADVELLAIFTLITVPLGPEKDDEYREMKEVVLKSVDVLVRKAGLEKKFVRAVELWTSTITDPKFIEFLKAKGTIQ